MGSPFDNTPAVKTPSRYAALNMHGEQFTGLWTQANPYRDAAVAYLTSKYYGGSRIDRIIDGLNREITQNLTDKRRPGSTVYNDQVFPGILSYYSWKYIQNDAEIVRVMVDTQNNIFDGTGLHTKLNIWNKNAGSGPTRFLGVNTELFFNDGIEPKKIVESALTWMANTLYDGAATSDTELGDFIIDTNFNVQQAVGGFTLLISAVSITNNVLTLTLDTSTLADPADTPTGAPAAAGGNLTAGNHFIRIAAVDPTGNVTEAGNESAAVATTGANGQIVWTWEPISGAVGYRIYVSATPGTEATYFTSSSNSFTQTVQTSTVSGLPPTTNSTSVDVPDNLFQMVGVELELDGLTTATYLNSQTITIASVLPGGQASNQITAAFTHADVASAPDTGTAVSGSGITGNAQPAWATTLWAVTQDGGAQWINRGSYIQNWGIATPASAPTIYQSKAPSVYNAWQPSTTYWPSRCSTNAGHILLLTTPGVTNNTGTPTWIVGAIGDTTTDGTAVWTYEGPTTWAATTAYTKGAYTTAAIAGLLYVYISQNAGTSGTDQSAWTGGVGAVISDGGVIWICQGIIIEYGFNDTFPARNLSTDNVILDSNGYLQQVQDSSIPTLNSSAAVSGVNAPTWGATGAFTGETLTATITDFFIATGVAQLSAVNEFPIGGPLFIAGMTVGTYLNGPWTLGLARATFFQFNVTHANVTTTVDSGTATVDQSTMWLNIGAYAAKSTAAATYVYAYRNSVTKHVGSASVKSAPVLLLAGFVANVQGFGSADPQVDTIMIFRTAQGEPTPLLVDIIANPGGGVPWTYVDTVPDVSPTGGPELNALIAAPINHVNDPPPSDITAPAYHLQRPWGISKNKVVYGGGPDTLVGSGNEAFAPVNEIPYPAQPIFLMPVTVQGGGILVFTTSGVYIILGTGTPSDPFYTTIYYASVNLAGYNAIDVYNTAVFLMEANGKVSSLAIEYPFNPQSGYTEIGFPIGDQFKTVTTGGINAALYNPATAYVSWNLQSSAETAMFVADGAVGWFDMQVINPPESGILWNPRAAIVGGTSAVQSVETSPGVHQLLIGPPAGTPGPILTRDATGTVFEDNGVAYPAWDIKGVMLLCSTGEWCEVVHVSAKSVAVGARPQVSTLMGEIRPTANHPWNVLKLNNKSNDPPETPKSESVFSDRYLLAENGVPYTGDCISIRFDYGSQAEPDELLDFGIFAAVMNEREEQVPASQ